MHMEALRTPSQRSLPKVWNARLKEHSVGFPLDYLSLGNLLMLINNIIFFRKTWIYLIYISNINKDQESSF